MKITNIFFLLFSLILFGTLSARSEILFERLTCDFRENPLGVDNPNPVFGWVIKSQRKNIQQAAYEIIVSDRLEDIQSLKGNKWSSGIQYSDNNMHVVYGGETLKSFTRYYWRIRVFDVNHTPSEWSDVARFDVAMLHEQDWQAKWIGDGSQELKEEEQYLDDPAPLFAKEFYLKKQIESAVLYISGLGYYEAYLNGKKIGNNVLDAGWTSYDHQILYNTYEVSDLLQKGKNKLGAIVGNGWYNLLPLRFWGRHTFRDALTTGRPILKAQLRIKYKNGDVELISTDESWKTTRSPIIRNSIFLGEHYDARLEDSNWFGLKAKNSVWESVDITSGPKGRMSAQTAPPIRIYKEIIPKNVQKLSNGKFLFDMGENFAGIVRFRVKGAKGQKITLRYGEDKYPDGSLNVMTSVAGQIKKPGIGGPGAPDIAWQEDSYIMKGDGLEEWQPKFTFHSFRYVEVSGWPSVPTKESLVGLALASDLKRTGKFSSSNAMFNQLYKVIDRTFLSNVLSVQSDCPAREKLGYGGDIVATAESYLFNYDMHTFYRKVVQDFANDQRENGGITETAPYVGISDEAPDSVSGPLGWQLAYPYLIKQLYEFYADTSLVRMHFNNVKRQVEFLEQHADNGLYFKELSDHEALDERPIALTASLFYYHHVHLLAEFSTILEKVELQDRYTALAEVIKQKIIQRFVKPNGEVDNGTQTAQVFALWYQIIKDDTERQKLINNLEIAFEKRGWHVSTGIFGTKMMFDVLRSIEKEDWAYQIANQRDFPGWGYMLDQGATTLWETWAYSDNMYSQNHPMFGSINEWFYRSILGINALQPGFREIKIKPNFVSGLDWADGYYDSIQGRITSRWKVSSERIVLDVEIPANTLAEVWLPVKHDTEIYEGNTLLQQSKAILDQRSEREFIVVRVGSGNYSFNILEQKKITY